MPESRSLGKWKQKGVPHRDWTCVGITDLRADDEDADLETCEMCEAQEIRFVHHMEHADHEPLDCGVICAGYMEQNRIRANEREKPLRLAADRKKRWLARKWRISVAGNQFLNVDGYNIVIFGVDGGKWMVRIMDRRDGATQQGRQKFVSERDAKLGALAALNWAKEYL